MIFAVLKPRHWCAALLVVALTGCGHYYRFYKKSADREVAKILTEKSPLVEGMPETLDIEASPDADFAQYTPENPLQLDLITALNVAVNHAREYQSQQERLYSEGLSLTLARHEWEPIFSSAFTADVVRDGKVNSRSRTFTQGLNWMFATGADLSVSLVTEYVRVLTNPNVLTSGSDVAVTLVQPLLRGFGTKVTLENLTQSERLMVYAIRDYVRFRKNFSTAIAKSYFRLFQLQDQLENERLNYENLRRDRERSELLAQAGRIAEFQVDQTRQDELSAQASFISAGQSFENALDEFKIQLGVPTETAVRLDPAEMRAFTARGIVPVPIPPQQAIDYALEHRLDLKNTRDRVDDSSRRIAVRQNELLPDLDVVFDYNNATLINGQNFNFNDETDVYGVSVNAALPLDRKAERNNYRQALIDYQAALREYTLQRDRTILEVRNTLRTLEEARLNYDIQKLSVQLAERRVESTTLLQQAGDANTRDVLEARRALLNSQNALTRTLVDHYNASLDLFLAMESLSIQEGGVWTNGLDEAAQVERLAHSIENAEMNRL